MWNIVLGLQGPSKDWFVYIIRTHKLEELQLIHILKFVYTALISVYKPVSISGQPINSGEVPLSNTGSLVWNTGVVSRGGVVGAGIVVLISSRLNVDVSVLFVELERLLLFVVVMYCSVVVLDTSVDDDTMAAVGSLTCASTTSEPPPE